MSTVGCSSARTDQGSGRPAATRTERCVAGTTARTAASQSGRITVTRPRAAATLSDRDTLCTQREGGEAEEAKDQVEPNT